MIRWLKVITVLALIGLVIFGLVDGCTALFDPRRRGEALWILSMVLAAVIAYWLTERRGRVRSVPGHGPSATDTGRTPKEQGSTTASGCGAFLAYAGALGGLTFVVTTLTPVRRLLAFLSRTGEGRPAAVLVIAIMALLHVLLVLVGFPLAARLWHVFLKLKKRRQR